jgi:hypothetical protein
MTIIEVTTLGMLITNRQQSSAMSFIPGLVAGFIGSKLVDKAGGPHVARLNKGE